MPVPRHIETGVVFLHGFSLGARSWEPQSDIMEALPSLAYDAFGHGSNVLVGDSSRLVGPDVLVAELEMMVRATGWDRVVLVGLSMGGNTAVLYARRNPRKTAGMVLLSTDGEDPVPDSFRSRALGYASLLEDLGIEAFAAEFLAQDRFSALGPAERDFVEKCILRNDPTSLAQVARGVLAGRETNLGFSLAGALPPALIVYGELDQACSVSAPNLAAAMPGSSVVALPGAGHLCNVERAEQVNEIVRKAVLEASRRG